MSHHFACSANIPCKGNSRNQGQGRARIIPPSKADTRVSDIGDLAHHRNQANDIQPQLNTIEYLFTRNAFRRCTQGGVAIGNDGLVNEANASLIR